MPEKPRGRTSRRIMLRWSLFLLLFWVAVMLIFKALENRLVYPGMKAVDGWIEHTDPATQEVWLNSSDGTKIHAWYLPCDGATGAIHFSHGNGGNLSHRDAAIRMLRDTFRRSVLIYDYPGYGHSEGRPSEAGVYAAGDAAWSWLKGKYAEDRMSCSANRSAAESRSNWPLGKSAPGWCYSRHSYRCRKRPRL